MRHRIVTKRLNMPVGRRKATIKNLLTQFYLQESLITTKARGVAIQAWADRLIQQAKPQTVHARRRLSRIISDPSALKKLVDELAVRYQDLPSGFTRIIPLGSRRGDNALMVKIELTRKLTAAKEQSQKTKSSEKSAEVKSEAKATTKTKPTKQRSKPKQAKKKVATKSKSPKTTRKSTTKK